MARTAITALHISDPPDRWRALGFHVDDRDVARIGGIDVHLGAAGHGITAWEITNLPARTTSLDGLATTTATPTPDTSPPTVHPNRAMAIDHVVVTTPDLDRTTAALNRAGIPLSRIANLRSATIRQGFRRLGPAILELVENPGARTGSAAFWGLVIVVPDLEQPHPALAEHLTGSRPAIQPGRQIATLDKAADLTPRLAFMDPEREEQPSR